MKKIRISLDEKIVEKLNFLIGEHIADYNSRSLNPIDLTNKKLSEIRETWIGTWVEKEYKEWEKQN